MVFNRKKEGENVRSSDVLLIRWFISILNLNPIFVQLLLRNLSVIFQWISYSYLLFFIFLSKKIFDFNQFRWERNNLMKKEKDLGLPVISSRPLPFFGKAITSRMVDVPQHMATNLSKKSFKVTHGKENKYFQK